MLKLITDPEFKTEIDHSLEDLNKYRGLPFSMDEIESQFFCLCQTLSFEVIEKVHQDYQRQSEMNNETEEIMDESSSYRSTLNDEENEDNSRELLMSVKSNKKPTSSSKCNNLTEEQKSDSYGEKKKKFS